MVPCQHSSLSSDHVWGKQLVKASDWGCLSSSSVAPVPSGTEVSHWQAENLSQGLSSGKNV